MVSESRVPQCAKVTLQWHECWGKSDGHFVEILWHCDWELWLDCSCHPHAYNNSRSCHIHIPLNDMTCHKLITIISYACVWHVSPSDISQTCRILARKKNESSRHIHIGVMKLVKLTVPTFCVYVSFNCSALLIFFVFCSYHLIASIDQSMIILKIQILYFTSVFYLWFSMNCMHF